MLKKEVSQQAILRIINLVARLGGTNKTKKIDISNKAGDTEPVAKTVKLTPKTYEVPRTKTKNEIRKNKSIDKKQSKADKARANGNLKKAARKEKAIDKKKARMAKRGGYQGQASNAIKPS